MADRGLTAKEFWMLSPEERQKRCGELSEHEAFAMRLMDPHLPVSLPCNNCKYYTGYAKCKAFPDGISADHMRAVMEGQTTECGDGFHFEKQN